ncbi:hypothetical protein [Chroococcus sp. FPU101]|uniref:hypothetical protein n=1 Tax=Chroococcus sp. FPU101 TaxID=1974212 RepID=UPI001A8E019A|nr:hypothetical protein [Chroococcus sp. FPU101]GFE70583.1 hypothetical protein CFPU101_31930 [Chroococcus sp. FPU101]
MAADDRKKKIWEHLNQSVGGIKYTSSTTKKNSPSSGITPSLEPEKPFVAPPPVPKVENRKRRVMDHLNLSSDDFKNVTNDGEKQNKQKIQEHLKKSLG